MRFEIRRIPNGLRALGAALASVLVLTGVAIVPMIIRADDPKPTDKPEAKPAETPAEKPAEKKGSGDGTSRPRRGGDKKASEERLAQLLKEHPEADTNKDGKISQQEAVAWRREHPTPLDPKVLEDYLKKNPAADTNKDGKLTSEEMRAYLKDHPETARGFGGAKGSPAVRLTDEEILKQHPEADKDKNGKLSVEEKRDFIRSQRKDGKGRGGKKSGEQKPEESTKKGDI